MAITFQYANPHFKLKSAANYKRWIKTVIHQHQKKVGAIHYRFASDEEVLSLNIQFLNHATYTDIITFDTCEGNTINGDIIISTERVKENANQLKLPFEEELRRVIIHGILHLCGYKDKSKPDRQRMRSAEEVALTQFIEF